MFPYLFIIDKVWSDNRLLPKASIIKTKMVNKYYPSLPTNNFGHFTYRLRFRIINISKLP